jgi:hypothetical protein
MEQNDGTDGVSVWKRLELGFRLWFSGKFARRVAQAIRTLETTAVEPAPERVHASGLQLLSALQREGRLVDFLQQDVASFFG